MFGQVKTRVCILDDELNRYREEHAKAANNLMAAISQAKKSGVVSTEAARRKQHKI